MERFDIRGENWGLQKRTDGLGAFCWADETLWYRRQYLMSLIINLVVVLVCGVLAAYLVYHKHDQAPMPTPTMDMEQIGRITQERQRLQVQLDGAQHKIADLKAKAVQLEKMVKSQNVVLQQREQQLKALAVSVPPQPIILEAIKKEAATEQGLRKVVERSFGKEIASRVEVR